MIAIEKQVTAANGANVSYHVLERVELARDADALVVLVASYPSLQSRDAGHEPSARAAYRLELSAVAPTLIDAITGAITATGPLAGGAALQEGTSLEIAKRRKLVEMKAACDGEIAADISTAAGAFPCNLDARQQYVGLMTISLRLNQLGQPSAVTVERSNGSIVNATTAQISDLALAVHTKEQVAYAKLRAVRQQIDAATTVAEVQAITWP
jgi:hypothetical protein